MHILTIQILIAVGVAFSALIILHAISFRLNFRIKLAASGQTLLLKSGGVINFFLILSYIRVAHDNQDWLWGLVYLLIIFNGLLYIYFHFYNMSETARRIRLLILIHTGSEFINVDNINNNYDVTSMVKLRLQRLQAMGQISQSEGKYFVIARLLMIGALALNLWRTLLRIKHSSE